MRKPILIAMSLVVLCEASVNALRCDEGRIPIFQPSILAQPGHYIVTRDISVSSGVILSISAPGVTLDLNGHTLSSSSTTDDVIRISAIGDPDVRILNGKLQGGGISIHAIPPGPCKLVVEGVAFGDPNNKGIFLEEAGEVEIHRVVIHGQTGAPGPLIDLRASSIGPLGSATISETRLYEGPDSRGISLLHVIGQITGGVIKSGVSSSGTPGPTISLTDASGSAIRGVVISWTQSIGDPGIDLINSSGIIINDNNLRGPRASGGPTSRHGIFADASSHDVKVTNNSVTGAGGDGIHVESEGSQILGNVVSRNGGEGIYIAGSNNLVDGNKVAGNQDGLYFNTTGVSGRTHAYRNNVLRGNTGAAVAGPGSTGVTNAGGNIF